MKAILADIRCHGCNRILSNRNWPLEIENGRVRGMASDQEFDVAIEGLQLSGFICDRQHNDLPHYVPGLQGVDGNDVWSALAEALAKDPKTRRIVVPAHDTGTVLDVRDGVAGVHPRT